MVYVKFICYICNSVILTKNAADEYQKGTCAHWIGEKIMPWVKQMKESCKTMQYIGGNVTKYSLSSKGKRCIKNFLLITEQIVQSATFFNFILQKKF